MLAQWKYKVIMKNWLRLKAVAIYFAFYTLSWGIINSFGVSIMFTKKQFFLVFSFFGLLGNAYAMQPNSSIGMVVPADDVSKPLPIPHMVCCYATVFSTLLRKVTESFEDTIYLSTLANIERYARLGINEVEREDSSAYSLAKNLLLGGRFIAVSGDPESPYIVFNRTGMLLNVPRTAKLAELANLYYDLEVYGLGAGKLYVCKPYLFVVEINKRYVERPVQWQPRIFFKPDIKAIINILRTARHR